MHKIVEQVTVNLFGVGMGGIDIQDDGIRLEDSGCSAKKPDPRIYTRSSSNSR